MNFLHICLFLCATFVEAKVLYYKKCYEELSICLITSIDDNPSISDDKSKLTRSSAEEWCEANSSMLAIILNETVESAMKKFIDEDSAKLYSDVITNGYRKMENNWTWINGRSSAIYPSGTYSTTRYVYLVASPDRNSYLSVSFSTSNRKFICSYIKHVSDYSCSEGYQQQRDVGLCYKIHNKEANWFDARNNCLKEGSDLGIFENGISSLIFEWSGDYWIGLRKESWDLWNGHKYLDLKYSNWDDGYPHYMGGDCLCLKARTVKWTNCDCRHNYRHVCIQEMTTAVTTNTTPTLSVGYSTVRFHSTSTQVLYNNFSDEASGNPTFMQEPGNIDIQRIIIWVPLAVLFAVLTVIVSRYAIVKLRKRSNRQEVSYTTNTCQPTSSVDDYTTLKRECLTGNDTTYAELDVYETIEDENHN